MKAWAGLTHHIHGFYPLTFIDLCEAEEWMETTIDDLGDNDMMFFDGRLIDCKDVLVTIVVDAGAERMFRDYR